MAWRSDWLFSEDAAAQHGSGHSSSSRLQLKHYNLCRCRQSVSKYLGHLLKWRFTKTPQMQPHSQADVLGRDGLGICSLRERDLPLEAAKTALPPIPCGTAVCAVRGCGHRRLRSLTADAQHSILGIDADLQAASWLRLHPGIQM